MMNERNQSTNLEPGVAVSVDVSKIVKYLCVAGVLIVAIIFITTSINNVIKSL